jgi:FkbM family methyltransferase
MSFVSYAQNFEDVMLWRALKHVQNGRYLDIGAQDPVEFSVSFAFYEHGWRGMHVEPNGHYAEKLRAARPDEAVLEIALGEVSGIVEFFDIQNTGLSTLQPDIAERHRENGFEIRSRLVPLLPLDEVLDRFSSEDLHWLKIDVEGAEQRVLEGWRKSSVRPWVLVVESTLPLSQEESHVSWESLLFTKGYRFAYFDGLNRFYVAEERSELLEAFGHPPCVFDDFTLAGPQNFCHMLASRVAELQKQVRSLDVENEHREAAFTDREKVLAATQQQLLQKADELESLRVEFIQLQSSIEALRYENARLEGLLTECDRSRRAVSECLQDLRAERDRLRSAMEIREAQFRELVQSRSWRFTRPLRGVSRLLRGEYTFMQRANHRARRTAKRLLRPILLTVMRHVLGRPSLHRWWGQHLKRWPALHRRLLMLASHSRLLEDSPTVAQHVDQPDALSSRAQQIYGRLQKARKSSGQV